MTTFSRAYPQPDPRAQALGLINWNYPPEIAAVALSPTSKTIYFSSIWLPAGEPVNNIVLWNTIPGSGSVPTAIYVFLDNGSVVVSQSANLKSNSGWTSSGGPRKYPLATTYTPPAAGYHRVCFLEDLTSAWGTTAVQLANRTTAGTSSKGDLTFEMFGTGGTAQTAPPGNGSALPTIAVAASAFWCGVSS